MQLEYYVFILKSGMVSKKTHACMLNSSSVFGTRAFQVVSKLKVEPTSEKKLKDKNPTNPPNWERRFLAK